MQFTYQTIHRYVYSSLVLSLFNLREHQCRLISEHFFPKSIPNLLEGISPSTLPSFWETRIYFLLVSVDLLILDISCKSHHTIRGLLCLPSSVTMSRLIRDVTCVSASFRCAAKALPLCHKRGLC